MATLWRARSPTPTCPPRPKSARWSRSTYSAAGSPAGLQHNRCWIRGGSGSAPPDQKASEYRGRPARGLIVGWCRSGGRGRRRLVLGDPVLGERQPEGEAGELAVAAKRPLDALVGHPRAPRQPPVGGARPGVKDEPPVAAEQ